MVQIEARESHITTERVWAAQAPLPEISVTYRNLRKVYIRVVKVDFTELHVGEWPTRAEDELVRAMIHRKPELEFNHDLPATADYQARTEKIAAPKGLKPGYYYLIRQLQSSL